MLGPRYGVAHPASLPDADEVLEGASTATLGGALANAFAVQFLQVTLDLAHGAARLGGAVSATAGAQRCRLKRGEALRTGAHCRRRLVAT
jgi:hypothetical protein